MSSDSFSDLKQKREEHEAAGHRSKAEDERQARLIRGRLRGGIKQYEKTIKSILAELRDAWYPRAKVVGPYWVENYRPTTAPLPIGTLPSLAVTSYPIENDRAVVLRNKVWWQIGEYYPAGKVDDVIYGEGYTDLVSVILEFDEGLGPIGFSCTRLGRDYAAIYAGLSRSELVAALRQLHAADLEAQRRP